MSANDANSVPVAVLSIGLLVFGACFAWLSPDAPFDRAAEGARQAGTVAEMKVISAAAQRYYLDHGTYASFLPHLRPYVASLNLTDGWGTPYVYSGTRHGFVLISLGRDRAPGPEPPVPWSGDPFEVDVVLIDGAFLVVPDASELRRTRATN